MVCLAPKKSFPKRQAMRINAHNDSLSLWGKPNDHQIPLALHHLRPWKIATSSGNPTNLGRSSSKVRSSAVSFTGIQDECKVWVSNFGLLSWWNMVKSQIEQQKSHPTLELVITCGRSKLRPPHIPDVFICFLRLDVSCNWNFAGGPCGRSRNRCFVLRPKPRLFARFFFCGTGHLTNSHQGLGWSARC